MDTPLRLPALRLDYRNQSCAIRTLASMSFQDQAQAVVNRQGSIAENPLIVLPITSYQQHQTPNPGARPASVWHVVLDNRLEAFHKPFDDIDVALARAYGQHRREPPIHECVAWRLAHELGAPLEELVAPTVLRPRNGKWGSLCLRKAGVGQTYEPMLRRPDLAKAVGFFDALIAQQDRHLGNMRWDSGSQRLGLFDHGYAFAVPGDYFNHSAFVEWRWNAGQQRLDAWEVAALQGLLNSYELHAVAPMLAPHRAQRLEERAQLMLASGAILAKGQW